MELSMWVGAQEMAQQIGEEESAVLSSISSSLNSAIKDVKDLVSHLKWPSPSPPHSL
ncbi:hypothetical protein HaLaN_22813 [Haematococcus lacustris]|uniref:Uncharacterized protein n=1 Tax=Haematococcus lacustris TaxID=44745 RepID=A0A699ZQH3_HAELA|nr:hypothetical protein HaLaN_22813 [Haematococcus lacustris]